MDLRLSLISLIRLILYPKINLVVSTILLVGATGGVLEGVVETGRFVQWNKGSMLWRKVPLFLEWRIWKLAAPLFVSDPTYAHKPSDPVQVLAPHLPLSDTLPRRWIERDTRNTIFKHVFW